MISTSIQTKAMEILEFLLQRYAKSTLFVVDIVAAALLFIPDPLLTQLGLKDFAYSYKSILGGVLLVGTILLIVIYSHCLFCWWKESRRLKGRNARICIDQASDWGKSLIRQLYESPSRSLKLPAQNANVDLMIRLQILTRPMLGDIVGFDCILQPWVVEFLDKNPKYLAKLPKFEKPYEIPSLF